RHVLPIRHIIYLLEIESTHPSPRWLTLGWVPPVQRIEPHAEIEREIPDRPLILAVHGELGRAARGVVWIRVIGDGDGRGGGVARYVYPVESSVIGMSFCVTPGVRTSLCPVNKYVTPPCSRSRPDAG